MVDEDISIQTVKTVLRCLAAHSFDDNLPWSARHFFAQGLSKKGNKSTPDAVTVCYGIPKGNVDQLFHHTKSLCTARFTQLTSLAS